MNYTYKKRAVPKAKQNHSLKYQDKAKNLNQIINDLTKLYKRNNYIIYILLMILLSIGFMYFIKAICELILIIGGIM